MWKISVSTSFKKIQTIIANSLHKGCLRVIVQSFLNEKETSFYCYEGFGKTKNETSDESELHFKTKPKVFNLNFNLTPKRFSLI